MPFSTRAQFYRMKALEAEKRAKEATDEETRAQWSELAIEWHTMASLAGTGRADFPD